MSRPKKCRKFADSRKGAALEPMDGCAAEEIIEMSVDEYETIRLIDYLNYNQESCAQQMGVARQRCRLYIIVPAKNWQNLW